ncbi:hypothetical protein L1049_001331 [Liquidambar formosana]|uniref:25S rRNA (uridine-N(3))-methyltransferase BMT5-like domain-containing protein n=1 Tax=Liquidambar formosana TaxID=63359 RepID=A0AAP0ND42_LIQFO
MAKAEAEAETEKPVAKEGEEAEEPVAKEEEGEEEKWVKYYSSNHQILLVGEGDFSFSLSLAVFFGSASNIVATSLDLYDGLIEKYKEAKSNLEKLEKLGACLLQGVDVAKMKLHPDLQMRKFDRIIYNFPHAGFHGQEDRGRVIRLHRSLVDRFFRNASGMLRANGEIHVNHRTTMPFCRWNIEELASRSSLALIECVDFKREDYPGYNNKRGAGPRCDEPFPLRECSTFKFRFSPTAGKMCRVRNQLGSTCRPQQLQDISIPMQRSPTSFDFRYPQTNFIANMNDNLGYAGPPSAISISHNFSWTFHGYFNQVMQTFGRTEDDVGYSVCEALRLGYERYMAEATGRTLNGDIYVLQELHRLGCLRSAWLQRRLLGPDHHSCEEDDGMGHV